MSKPVVTSISPDSGSTAGGNIVTITGTGFTGASNISFGPTRAAAMTPNGDTQVTATSPPGKGTVDITVTTEAGISDVGQAGQFTYTRDWRQVWYWASWAIAAAFAVWMVVALLRSEWAQAFGAGTAFAGLALLTLLGRGSYGAFSALIGIDCRTSTSKVQAGVWTVVLAWGFAFLLGRHVFENQPLQDVLPQDTWDQYLIVLGGPFAAAVLAKGIVTYQLTNGTLTKTTAEPNSATINQVLQSDSGQTDLVDSQYFLFNLVAIVYFIVQIAREPVLPTMPAVLLAATSGAAALYVGNKAASSNKPMISSVVPRTARPGDVLTITGSNILGGGKPSQVQVVMASSGPLTVQGDATDSRVRAALPAGAPAGQQDLFIVSGAANSSDNYNIEVMADAPVIVGLDPPLVTRGQPVTIYGRWFTSLQLPAVNSMTVQFDDSNPIQGDIDVGDDLGKPDSVTVTVPDSLAGPITRITLVNTSGAVSPSFSAAVRSP